MEVCTPIPNAIAIAMLQWGHDKIVMEVSYLYSRIFRRSQLQWGHDKIVMEVADITNIDVLNTLLQWGHDKIVMEVQLSIK